MLNNIRDPFPDKRDPVTGDWLPSSYSDILQASEAIKSQKEQSSMSKQYSNLLMSIFK